MQRTITLDVTEHEHLTSGLVYTPFGDLTFKLLHEHGPAGGNPVVELSGEDAAVLLWLLESYTRPAVITGNPASERAAKQYRGSVNEALYTIFGEGAYQIS